MSDELRAACEKIRDLSGDIEDCLLGGMPHDTVTYRGSLLHELLEASLVLQKAYLAEHPADDGESVTRDWLAESGWDVPSYWPAIKTPCGGFLEWRLTLCWIGVEPVAVVKTRGDVRRLLSALGITPK